MENAILYGFVIAILSILLDFLLGVFISIKKKEFSINKLPQFLANNIFPYIGGLGIIALVAFFVPEFEYLFYAGVGFVALKYSKEALIDKVKMLIQGTEP